MTPDPVSGVTPVLGRKEARYRFSLIVVSAQGLCWNAFDLDLHSHLENACFEMTYDHAFIVFLCLASE